VAKAQPNWANVAESYEAWYQTPRGRRYDALEKDLIAGFLGPARGGRLLEIGCGSGHFSRWFREFGWKVCGLDLEERMLVRAREFSGNGIFYCRGEAEKLPFADKSFHVSAMITTLESTAHPEMALAEAMRVSRERVVLGVLNSLSPLALSRRIRAIFRPTIFSQTRFYSAPVLCAIIRRVARRCDVPVSLKMASWRRVPLVDLPLGAFYAVAVMLKK
jgi:ubiquinone/menaquinone biosynthesis C-methylase UbiE